jgi:cytoskeletal protein RodZ
MLRSVVKILVLTLLLLGAAVATVHYRTSRSLEAQLEQEQQRSAELKQIVSRLTSERRVADVIVTSQDEKAEPPTTSIVFVEYAPDGSALPAKRFTIAGKTAHIDAMVIKFDGRFVAENDALRGHSIALFMRLFGPARFPPSIEVPTRPSAISSANFGRISGG